MKWRLRRSCAASTPGASIHSGSRWRWAKDGILIGLAGRVPVQQTLRTQGDLFMLALPTLNFGFGFVLHASRHGQLRLPPSPRVILLQHLFRPVVKRLALGLDRVELRAFAAQGF